MKRGWLKGALLFALVTASGAQAAELVVYSGRSDKFVKPVMERFTEQTGIQVKLHNASSTALLNKLRLEGSRTQADLYLSNDAGNLQLGSDLDLFQPIPAKQVGVIESPWRAPDNTWVGLSARARVLVVNTDADEDVAFVESVFDLADPKLKGRVGITHSSNASFIAGTTVYMIESGQERVRQWLTALKDNAADNIFNKHGRIVDTVARGELAVGLVNHYYIYRHLDDSPEAPIAIRMPDQGGDGMGVAVNVAGVAISRHTDQPDEARRLVAFLVSKGGQKIFAEVNREYPTRSGVPAADEVPPLSDFRTAPVPMYKLGRQRDDTLRLLEQVGMP